MRKGPIVNLNTAALIKELVGDYTLETQDLIHAIAENQSELLKQCANMDHYKAKMERFISEYK